MPQGIDTANLLWLVPAVLGLLGVFMMLRGLGKVFQARVISGGLGTLTGGLFVAVGAATALLGLNIHTYQRLTYEQPVATISFRQLGPQDFVATLRTPDGAGTEYNLTGDQWQMDARVLKFHPWANMMGFDTVYRLDRLSGRYGKIEDERNGPRALHNLSQNPGLDIYELGKQFGGALQVVDASYGAGTYVPMVDGAEYQVSLTQGGGLVPRPTNDTAKQAVAQPW
jgi:hypothetical protein